MAVSAKTQRRQVARARQRPVPSVFSAPLRLCASAFLLSILSAASAAIADEPKPLDQQLLDDLDGDLLQGLPGPTRPPTAAPSDLQSEPPTTSDNPLAKIAERMRAAQQRIARRDTSEPTQQLQQQIQRDLAALIEEAEKQCAACNKSGKGQGSLAGSTGGNPIPAPPRDSTDRIEQGDKEAVETADVQDVLRRFWGHLPEKMREQMQSSLGEQFLPKYERLIEDYYLRLAEDPRAAP